MSAHKSIDKICAVIVAFTLVIAALFCFGTELGIETSAHAIGYENRIFDRSRVHTVDIVMNGWDSFIETCENEEYSKCDLVIDGEAVRNVGIRAKGNTSLSSVKSMGSSRYSFKIEFDQYDSTKSYHGLDKLCLNNIIQDNTYMKDYLAYTLMSDFGVDSPLCSYAYITVNGEDWGLYLAVEAIEESFLQRNYGSNYGDLYKPDSMSFGGGRGNGRDFDMDDLMEQNTDTEEDSDENSSDGKGGFNMPNFGGGNMPAGGMNFGGFGGGMGSSDVKLQYIDDDPDSYSNIFGNAKTTVNQADKKRLISSLKALSEQSDIENTVDADEVIRYFVVHDFLVNGDSYTGMMIHNYYLYEKDGQLSMIPWDYNLAYGSFQGGDASSSVNSPIDTPVSNGMSDRPMIAWIFDSEEYTNRYHELMAEFISSCGLAERISETAEMIAPYVEKDQTKFCTYEEFQKGVEAMSEFCSLRIQSVSGQLDGSIPSTTEGQRTDSSSLIDTGSLTLSDMGSMGKGGGGFGGFGGNKQSRSEKTITPEKTADNSESDSIFESTSARQKPDFGGQMPEGFDPSQFGGQMPEDFDSSQFGGQMPGGRNGGSSESSKKSGSDKTADKSEGMKDQSSKVSKPAGSFSGTGTPAQDSTTEYILLGASAAILLLGLVFARLFKR